MTNEYESYEHGDYSVIITPDNVDEIAQQLVASNPNYPTYVFRRFAETIYYEEMPFSIFMDMLDQALEDEIDDTLRQMTLEGKCDISCADDGSIEYQFPDTDEEDSTESE